jgi:uncharacterized protein
MTELDAPSRQVLLALARSAIAAELGLPAGRVPDAAALGERRGAFVTLTIRGELRGCIGRIEADAELRELLPAVARSAAFADPRFPPLSRHEFSAVRIEVSLLTPPAPADPSAVEVGRHGVIVSSRGRRGLLLPQVPTEYGWTREEFLTHVCLKASLAPDAWRDEKTTLLVFEAEVFAEEDDRS